MESLDSLCRRAKALLHTDTLSVWPDSVNISGKTAAFMADTGAHDVLCIAGPLPGFSGSSDGVVTVCPLGHQNAQALRACFPFTAPVPVLKYDRSVGVGDRLGIASPGHIRVFRRFDAMPVLAQQSIRELNLTHRTYSDVIDCASFAVFREGFRRGFGADGDHLKTREEIEYALKSGCTMITLDCSEHICSDAAHMDADALRANYTPDQALEQRWLNRSFRAEAHTISFTPEDLMRAQLLYGKAIAFAAAIWAEYIAPLNGRVDFEISIDETPTPTSPQQHFFVAAELLRLGVRPDTVAPRFCGEFQKGVDYSGDLKQFEREAAVHAAIARHFGYKLSIHSGSDKFSVFPILGRETRGRFHLKTAGTNWLEAMRLVAEKDPALYRQVHAYAITAFPEAAKYYHVSTSPATVPPLDTLPDAALPALFRRDDARQLIHITYGLILTAAGPDGRPLFKYRLYALWRTYAQDYAQLLDNHIGKHLDLLMQKSN